MTQTVKLPNGDTINFPDDMPDDAIAKVISDNYPDLAPKAAAPRVLAGLPVDNPVPAVDPHARVLAGLPVNDPASTDDGAAPLLDDANPQQNQFAANRMSRADYEKEFRTLNPRASQAAVDAALAQYDQQKAAQLKAADAKRQAGPMKPVPTADEFFNQRLNARLQQHTADVNDPQHQHGGAGVVPQLPGYQQQDFGSTSTKHVAGQDQADPGADDESTTDRVIGAAKSAGSFLGRSTAAGLYDLAGAGAKLVDALNPFTLSDADAAILYKNDPAKLKQMQDESIAMGLSRFARAMQEDSSAQMDKMSDRAKHDYGQLEYATLDPNKSAFLNPLKIVGDAVRSLPSSLAMGVTAYFTRGASLRAEQAALAAGLGQEAATAAGVQAAMKYMGNAGAASEGAIGYAQQAIQSADDASKIPMDKLAKTPQFQNLLRQGYTPETARAKIIADIGEHAGQIGGLVDGVTNKFGGAILGKIISEGGPMMRRILSGAADESATEFVQSAGEQMGQNYANQLNADPDTPLMQGVGEAAVAGAAVGGFMGGATAGVAGHHGHVDEHQLEQIQADARQAEATRQASLSAWRNNGLSPGTSQDGNSRVEPTWSDAVGAASAAPAARVEPSLGAIASATSVDDAIAAAVAFVDTPTTVPYVPAPPGTPHATPADIDALEQAAGLNVDHTPQESQAAHDQLMAEMQARAQEAAGKRQAETLPADLPPGGEAAPAAGLTGKESGDAADWHAFPPESRTLGVPRAQMPQIRAEHRGAMVNFLNARDISHEEVEVAPESLKPTQREFSISKVQKALEYEGGNRAILISSDNYVLDGHHQWLAAIEKGEPIRAIRLNAPIKQLVKTVHEFPSATVDTSSATTGGLGQGAQIGTTTLDPARPLSPFEASQQRIARQEEIVRQAIEKQAQHRAGQAPQQPGSSVPTAAERAPLPAPKPTAGQRMRERIRQANPFLAFLATHGLHIDERSDTGGQKGRAGNVIVPGFGGSLYRRTGARIDELAQLAHEAGFLSDEDMANPADNGGTRKLADMIERAVHSKEVIEQPGLLEAHAPSENDQLLEEAQRLGIDHAGMDADQLYDAVRAANAREEAQRETTGASDADEQDAITHYADQITPQELADADIPFDLNDSRLIPTHDLTDEQIDALFGVQKTTGTPADRGEAQGHAEGSAREGAPRTGDPGQHEGQDLLTSYTPGDVVAREDAATARAKAVQAERDRLEAQRQKEQDANEARTRADATVDHFQLGQDAHDQLSGQTGLFDAPAPAAKQADMERQDFPAKSGVGKISAVKERYGDKFGVSWASTNITTVDTMEHAAAIARAVAESDAENIKDMRRVAQDEQRRLNGIGRDGMRESDRAAKDLDSAVEEFTIQTKEELDDITPAEVRAGAVQWAKDAGLNEGEFLRTLYRKWTRNANHIELQELASALLDEHAKGEAQQEPAAGKEFARVTEGPTAQRLRSEDKHVFSQARIHTYDATEARPVLFISCSEPKLEGGPHRAVDLYQGGLFDVLRKWMPQTNRPDVYIISAKHGLVHANDLLEHYEQPMTAERLEALMKKGINARDIGDKNFSQVFIAGSAPYRELGQTYAERLRKAGYLGPDAEVLGSAPSAGIGVQRGDLADYLKQLEAKGTPATEALAQRVDDNHERVKQLDAERSARTETERQAEAEKKAAEVKTPGTNLVWSSLGEWMDAYQQLDGRAASSKRNVQLKEHIGQLAKHPEVIGRETDAAVLEAAKKRMEGLQASRGQRENDPATKSLQLIGTRLAEVQSGRAKLDNGTAPEHVTEGVDDRELGQIVKEFNHAQAEMMQGEHPVSNVFQPPAKNEVVRLEDKTRVYTKEHGWMTPAEARQRIAEWKEHAQKQGEDAAARSANSQRVVLSLFDLTGKWSEPWEEAGYQVYRFDIQDDPVVGDVNNFSTDFFGDWFGHFDGMDVYAILAATPCTDFASSGSRHFAAKDADGRTVASVKLVHQTLRTIEHFKPPVWSIENPVGRIEKLGGLPPWRLSFNPNHLGDPYTKRTLLWGRFNGNLPIAPVEPTEGSKMHKLYGGKSMATKNARSATPEGFSYGFFMANNAIDNPAMAIANKYDRLDRSLIEKAVAAGVTEDEITSAVDDHYYMDMDDHAANDAIRELTAEAQLEGRKAPAAADAAHVDDGSDIPAEFYPGVTAQYRSLGTGELSDMPAHQALAKTREDIQQLEDMLKCMGA